MNITPFKSDKAPKEESHRHSKGRYNISPYGFAEYQIFAGNPKWFSAYFTIMELAKYQDEEDYVLHRKRVIKRGQLVTTVAQLEIRLGYLEMSTQNIRSMLRHFKEAGLIHTHTLPHKAGTIITLCKYEEFHQRSTKPNKVPNKPTNMPANNVSYINQNKQDISSKGTPLAKDVEELVHAFTKQKRVS